MTAAPQTPVGTIPISEGAAGDLRRALGGLPFAGPVADLVEEAYTAGSTFGASFQRLLGKLLAPYGLLYLDPLVPSARQLAAPLLARALERSADLVRLVLERNQALAAAGYHAQVHVEPESSLLFLLKGGRRLPLVTGTGGLQGGDLSPNALLRPVVQDYMLPTVASVMGPAEVAYMAQAQVIYQELLGRTPVVVPRAAFTILDSHSARLLARYALSLDDFFQGEEALRERAARTMTPPESGQEHTAVDGGHRGRHCAVARRAVAFRPDAGGGAGAEPAQGAVPAWEDRRQRSRERRCVAASGWTPGQRGWSGCSTRTVTCRSGSTRSCHSWRSTAWT